MAGPRGRMWGWREGNLKDKRSLTRTVYGRRGSLSLRWYRAILPSAPAPGSFELPLFLATIPGLFAGGKSSPPPVRNLPWNSLLSCWRQPGVSGVGEWREGRKLEVGTSSRWRCHLPSATAGTASGLIINPGRGLDWKNGLLGPSQRRHCMCVCVCVCVRTHALLPPHSSVGLTLGRCLQGPDRAVPCRGPGIGEASSARTRLHLPSPNPSPCVNKGGSSIPAAGGVGPPPVCARSRIITAGRAAAAGAWPGPRAEGRGSGARGAARSARSVRRSAPTRSPCSRQLGAPSGEEGGGGAGGVPDPRLEARIYHRKQQQ